MSAAHTPGPWQVSHSDPTEVCDCDGEVAGCAPIAYIARRNPRGRSEDYANARLIAAAPDLLACMEEVRKFLMLCGPEANEFGMLDRAQAAIDKATGGAA